MTGATSILLLSRLPEAAEQQLETRGPLLRVETPEHRRRLVAEQGAAVRIVVTTGLDGLSAAEIDALPALQLVCSLGAGWEAIDLEHARRKGIALSYGPNTNAEAVADHALALILGARRRLLSHHATAQAAVVRSKVGMSDQIHGKRLGLLGMGQIGGRIARRAQGFEMQVAYHARHRRDDLPYAYFDQLLELARWCDVLVLAAPGGAATRHIVDAEVLAALGSEGCLVNVARASLVDQAALVHGLATQVIRAAALDVYDDDPAAMRELAACPNLLLSPHIAGRSPESMQAMVDLVLRNIDSHLSGRGVITPIPSP
ncbi:MAG: 2-hydroxyacid dehydrogenase [Burkholderiales bacterium]|nr:2-hydroxyacid dehydrogenase [Burkholderiales bacterium]MDE1925572.1 2-hydroxyacid dehydrogenase [Burkholderiales bacterium]MDE2157936.1 2-hydroxyacid dehydrogenase [Burkholderiales bacterium]MDE2503267.1 2-hydroxyacid dehydrogenase [Burkholderiales bacterium]